MNIKITIDGHGAVVIPDVVRQSLGLKEAGELILDTFGDSILLRAADSTAVETVFRGANQGVCRG